MDGFNRKVILRILAAKSVLILVLCDDVHWAVRTLALKYEVRW